MCMSEDPPPRLREWRAKGVFLFIFCVSRMLGFCAFTVGIFTVGTFTVGMFTVGMSTVGMSTVGIFTVGLVLFVFKGGPPTSPSWIRRVSRVGVVFWH